MKKNIKKFTELKSVGIETAGSSRMVWLDAGGSHL
jgi:hypothetical protein